MAARTLIALTTVAAAAEGAVTFTAADAANGMYFVNDGRTVLLVKNADASPHTATISSVPDPYGRTGDIAVVTAAGATNAAGVLPTALFNQTGAAALGQVFVGFDAGTSVTVAAIKLGA